MTSYPLRLFPSQIMFNPVPLQRAPGWTWLISASFPLQVTFPSMDSYAYSVETELG